MKLFGSNLAMAMADKGYSQAKLAEALGTTQQTVSRWIKDQAEPSMYNILCICSLLGETPNYLLGYDDDEVMIAVEYDLITNAQEYIDQSAEKTMIESEEEENTVQDNSSYIDTAKLDRILNDLK